MKVNIIALCSLFACQNVPAIKEKETIKYYLSQYENFKHFDLKNLNQNVTDILIEIASDPNEKRFYRERALGALQEPTQEPAQPTPESILEEAMNSAEQTKAALERDIASMARSIIRLAEAQPTTPLPSADYIVSLSLLIVKEILGRELQQDPTPLIAMLQDLIKEQPSEKLQVRGNTTTLALLQRIEPELASKGLALATDAGLQDYDLIVETPTQAIAYQPMQQLEALREKLRALFAQGRLS